VRLAAEGLMAWRTLYRLVLEAAEADGLAPPAVRLRAILKRAWRSDRLRCRRVEQLSVDGQWGPPDEARHLRDGDGI
jgi:hypothetical protein